MRFDSILMMAIFAMISSLSINASIAKNQNRGVIRGKSVKLMSWGKLSRSKVKIKVGEFKLKGERVYIYCDKRLSCRYRLSAKHHTVQASVRSDKNDQSQVSLYVSTHQGDVFITMSRGEGAEVGSQTTNKAIIGNLPSR